MILPETLLKNQEKIKTKNNKGKEEKNQEQTVITEKPKQKFGKTWRNKKKKEERNKKNQEEIILKKEETIRTEKKWGNKNKKIQE